MFLLIEIFFSKEKLTYFSGTNLDERKKSLRLAKRTGDPADFVFEYYFSFFTPFLFLRTPVRHR